MRDTSTSRGNRLVKKPALRFALLALTFSAAFNCVETADARLPQNLISTFNPIPQGHTGDRFGSAIAVNEETVVVGLPGHDSISGLDTGAVQVFYGTATPGIYNCVQILQTIGGALPPAPADNCGYSVAISPNWIVAGSPNWDYPGPPIIYNAGAVFIWRKIAPNLWDPIAKGVLHDNKFEQDRFGTSVALQEEVINGENIQTLAVGAPSDGLGNGSTQGAYANRGSVSLYRYDNVQQSWTLNGFIPAIGVAQIPQNLLANGYFGVSMAISGDFMLIGAHRQSANVSKQGTAFLFKRGTFVGRDPVDANKLWGEWHFVQALVSPFPKLDDQFGWSVSITPWNIIIGAPAGIAGSPTEKGSATIWTLDPSSLPPALPATCPSIISGENPGDQFGYSVLIKSQITLIGAVGVDTGAVSNTGRIYEYVRYSDACNQWTITQPILPPALANIPNSGFGTSLELGYNCVLISAPNGNNQALNQGAIFAFDTPPSIEPCDSDLNGDGGTGSIDMSIVLSNWGNLGGEGDINGDGIVNAQDLLYIVSDWGPCICGG
jgi:FG-GAP repeat